MGDFVDSLTDAELRTKLAEYGFPVVPITTTTRKVMTKKLKMLIENKNKIHSEGRRSLAKYSSEEESDDDVRTKRDKNRRITMAAGMLPPVSTNKATRKSTRKIESHNDNDGLAASSVTETKTRRTTRLIKPVAEADLETGSDSEPEVVDEFINDTSGSDRAHSSFLSDTSKPTSSYRSYLSSRSPLSGSPTPGTRSTPPKPLSTSTSTSSYTSSTTRYSSSVVEPDGNPGLGIGTGLSSGGLGAAGLGGGDSSVERLNQIRSRLSLGAYDRKIGGVSDEAPAEAPFLSNFSKRLSQLSNSSAPKPEYSYKNDIIKEHDANGSSTYNRSYLSRMRNRDYPSDFKSRQEKNIFKNNFVSFTLIGIAVAFFIGITVMYMGIRTDQNTVVQEKPVLFPDFEIPLCEDSELGAKPGINCVLKDSVTDAVNLMKVLVPELRKRAIAKHCSDVGVKPYMDDDQIIEFVSNNYALKDPYEIQKAINNLQLLIFRNSKWGISVIRADKYQGETTALERMEDILKNRPTRNLALIILNPDLPWKCIIYNKLYTIISSLFIVGAGFAAVIGGQKMYKYILNQRKIKNEKVYNLVEKIIDILQSNPSDNADNFLAVNHVRDMLIPPQERKAMATIWNTAVKFLEENESRIRTEVQIVSGEEFHVWRWLGANLNSTSSPRSRSWQGQAFETQSGSVNSLPCSPTPCLKVRGMVEERERNLVTVRDAVIAKCAAQCRLLHCEPDLASRCVYIKCATQHDAAVAYQNLHGWWYDGTLVTVKYLRLERYMQRYPNSPVRGPPFLTASTDAALENDWTNNDD